MIDPSKLTESRVKRLSDSRLDMACHFWVGGKSCLPDKQPRGKRVQGAQVGDIIPAVEPQPGEWVAVGIGLILCDDGLWRETPADYTDDPRICIRFWDEGRPLDGYAIETQWDHPWEIGNWNHPSEREASIWQSVAGGTTFMEAACRAATIVCMRLKKKTSKGYK